MQERTNVRLLVERLILTKAAESSKLCIDFLFLELKMLEVVKSYKWEQCRQCVFARRKQKFSKEVLCSVQSGS